MCRSAEPRNLTTHSPLHARSNPSTRGALSCSLRGASEGEWSCSSPRRRRFHVACPRSGSTFRLRFARTSWRLRISISLRHWLSNSRRTFSKLMHLLECLQTLERGVPEASTHESSIRPTPAGYSELRAFALATDQVGCRVQHAKPPRPRARGQPRGSTHGSAFAEGSCVGRLAISDRAQESQ